MSDFTPKKRLQIYEKALADYESGNNAFSQLDYGFCFYFSMQNIEVEGPMDVSRNFKELFPELYAQKPNISKDFISWFPWGNTSHGRTSRIKCLKAAIRHVKLNHAYND